MAKFTSTPVARITAAGMVFLELIKIALVATLTIMLVRYFLFKPFYVEGASMAPTFEEREYLIIDELTYRFKQPQRGDTIVFRYPYSPDVFYLKRVICLPGERCTFSKGEIIVFNEEHPKGVVIDEPYIASKISPSFEAEVVLGEDEYYVLGDNRGNSFDSRRFGPIRDEYIIGRVLFRGWPLERVGFIGQEEYLF